MNRVISYPVMDIVISLIWYGSGKNYLRHSVADAVSEMAEIGEGESVYVKFYFLMVILAGLSSSLCHWRKYANQSAAVCGDVISRTAPDVKV